MGTYPPPYQEPTFEPTVEQLERDRILRRRTQLYIYLPLSIVSLIAIVLIVLILIGIFAPGIKGTEEFISALADIIIILWAIPAMILVSIFPIAYFAYRMNKRQQRKLNPQTGPLANRSRLQIFAWRLQRFMDQAEGKTSELAPKVAKPVISFNALIAQIGAWIDIFTRPFIGSTNDDRDGNGDESRSRDGSGS